MAILRRTLFTVFLLFLLVYVGLIAYAYWPVPEGVPAEQLAGPEDKFTDVDGLKIRYREWGTPRSDTPALVLIHGFANSAYTYHRIGPLLADDYHVLALDLPGFGLSDKPDDHDYSNASQAAVVEGFARALGLESYVVGGHSMGGAHVIHVINSAPEAVGGILFNPGIITTGVPVATEYFVFPLPRLSAKTFGDREFRERFVKTSFVKPEVVTPDVVDQLMLAAQTDDYMSGATQMMRFYASGDEISMLNDVRVPVLIVWGDLDKNKPDGEAEELQSLIAGSRLVHVPEAAHYVHEEAPEASAQAIIDARDFWGQQR